MQHASKLRATCYTALLLASGAVCLAAHFEIYRRTSASAFVNQPELYFGYFIIRDSSGHSIREVSMAVGLWSYITAVLSVVLVCLGLMRFLVVLSKRRAANQAAPVNAPAAPQPGSSPSAARH